MSSEYVLRLCIRWWSRRSSHLHHSRPLPTIGRGHAPMPTSAIIIGGCADNATERDGRPAKGGAGGVYQTPARKLFFQLRVPSFRGGSTKKVLTGTKSRIFV